MDFTHFSNPNSPICFVLGTLLSAEDWRTGEENGERAGISGKVEGSRADAFFPFPMIPRAPCFFSVYFPFLSIEASVEDRVLGTGEICK